MNNSVIYLPYPFKPEEIAAVSKIFTNPDSSKNPSQIGKYSQYISEAIDYPESYFLSVLEVAILENVLTVINRNNQENLCMLSHLVRINTNYDKGVYK